ncbi:MAG: ImmA/IrrE family metallo-endopeptidase [Planctomycetota bacterium]
MARMRGKDFDRALARRASRRGRHVTGYARVGTTGEDWTEIDELAQAVADEHCPAGRVEPGAIARAKGITVSFGHYEDAFDGMLEFLDGRFHVYVSVDRVGAPDSPRARFTLAHELGHYYIDAHRLALMGGRATGHGSACEYESPDLAEGQADRFAANLLLPRARFLSAARAATPGLPGVLELAERFGVSVTAAAIRCAECDVWPCAVVKWTWRGYAWKHVSSSVFRAGFRRTFESPADLPPDSPTRLALAHEPTPPPGFFQAGTTASAWLPGLDAADRRNIILIEQAIPLGRWGVLTFLHSPHRSGL